MKSELIIRSGLTESCFTTRNHSGGGDYVAVRMVVPKAEVKEVKPTEENRAEPPKDAECSLPVESQKESVAETSVEQEALQGQLVSLPVKPYTFALRANLLRWATLTPDLGVEWRINRNWGILVNGSWTSWSWDDKNRRYALWEVSPEVRWYLGKEKRGYLGAMYKAGSFNYKFSETGRQGDLMGGGLTGGYRLKLNRSFDLDFTLGVGCLHADYEKYTVTDGVRVKQGEGCKNYWGVTNAGITLVWKLK